MTPHPRDRVLWWVGAAIHLALMIFETFLFVATQFKVPQLLALIAASIVLGAYCVKFARGIAVRKPPFRRQM